VTTQLQLINIIMCV